jgi:hypothetical protein
MRGIALGLSQTQLSLSDTTPSSLGSLTNYSGYSFNFVLTMWTFDRFQVGRAVLSAVKCVSAIFSRDGWTLSLVLSLVCAP